MAEDSTQPDPPATDWKPEVEDDVNSVDGDAETTNCSGTDQASDTPKPHLQQARPETIPSRPAGSSRGHEREFDGCTSIDCSKRVHSLQADKRRLSSKIQRIEKDLRSVREQLQHKKNGAGNKTKRTWPAELQKVKGNESLYPDIYKLSCYEENANPRIVHPALDFKKPTAARVHHELRISIERSQRAAANADPAEDSVLDPHTPRSSVLKDVPASVKARVFELLFSYPGKLIHAISRLDPLVELEDIPSEDDTKRSGLLNRFHITGKRSGGRCSLTYAIKGNDLLAPFLVSHEFLFLGAHAFYGCNTFAFSSLGKFGRFTRGIGRARRQRLQHVELLWIGSQAVTMEGHSRRTWALVSLCELDRLRSLTLYIDESEVRRKHEGISKMAYLAKKTSGQPDFRLTRNLRTLQGIDYVRQTRGLRVLKVLDCNTCDTVRDWSFVLDLETTCKRDKPYAAHQKSKLERLLPLSRGVFAPPESARKAVESYYDTAWAPDKAPCDYDDGPGPARATTSIAHPVPIRSADPGRGVSRPAPILISGNTPALSPEPEPKLRVNPKEHHGPAPRQLSPVEPERQTTASIAGESEEGLFIGSDPGLSEPPEQQPSEDREDTPESFDFGPPLVDRGLPTQGMKRLPTQGMKRPPLQGTKRPPSQNVTCPSSRISKGLPEGTSVSDHDIPAVNLDNSDREEEALGSQRSESDVEMDMAEEDGENGPDGAREGEQSENDSLDDELDSRRSICVESAIHGSDREGNRTGLTDDDGGRMELIDDDEGRMEYDAEVPDDVPPGEGGLSVLRAEGDGDGNSRGKIAEVFDGVDDGYEVDINTVSSDKIRSSIEDADGGGDVHVPGAGDTIEEGADGKSVGDDGDGVESSKSGTSVEDVEEADMHHGSGSNKKQDDDRSAEDTVNERSGCSNTMQGSEDTAHEAAFSNVEEDMAEMGRTSPSIATQVAPRANTPRAGRHEDTNHQDTASSVQEERADTGRINPSGATKETTRDNTPPANGSRDATEENTVWNIENRLGIDRDSPGGATEGATRDGSPPEDGPKDAACGNDTNNSDGSNADDLNSVIATGDTRHVTRASSRPPHEQQTESSPKPSGSDGLFNNGDNDDSHKFEARATASARNGEIITHKPSRRSSASPAGVGGQKRPGQDLSSGRATKKTRRDGRE